MVWNSQPCGTEDSITFKQGRIYERISNITCSIYFCTTYSRLEWYCYSVIILCLLVLLIGFLGNAFTLFYCIYTVKSWTTSSIFLFNLALCDFAWILLTPYTVYYQLHNQAICSSQVFCQFQRTFFDINIYGSIYFLTLISFDRYISAAHPIHSLKFWNKSKATLCTITAWIFILIESIPDFYYTFVDQKQMESAACLETIGEPLYFVVPFTIARVLFGFLIPITVIFTCYALTLKALRKMKKGQQTRNSIIKPLVLVLSAMIVFAVAFIPYHMMMMAVLIFRMKNQLTSENISLVFTMYKLTKIICTISSCLNPVIFMLTSKKFQEKIKTIKCSLKQRWLCCQSHKVGNTTVEL
ncbi:P2Y purinoceptor 1-like [Candoia aspera]|uniref:P2Y purinoceptor 1-like n=1 Tax=Candoia aspera TaxID=51853 RepID=UPI002FD85CA7